jgi:xylan 1,4-beta-xylosidase
MMISTKNRLNRIAPRVFKYPILIILFLIGHISQGQTDPSTFQNPILPGFNPDPSICRVGDDYYLVTSSFVWFPGIPVYHSKDLVNWELIGHGINRPDQLNFDGLKDEKGIWAVTIRYHNGLFYLITTCSDCGGNFYITAEDPKGSWSDPVWLKDAPGIDPSLFWNDDGKCYYIGNTWSFKSSWPSQVAIWLQELDLKRNEFIGERNILTYGHANNAAYAEGPHVYKIDTKYLLLASEGGTNTFHAITAHHSDSLKGPFVADKINPVLSHRQLGSDYPIQAVGHADLVQTQNGEWWSVVLGKRIVNNQISLTRETFLCPVKFENGTPIFNPGFGKILTEQPRPNLPWTPVKTDPLRDNFDMDCLALKWHFVRNPPDNFYQFSNDQLILNLRPEVADSMVNSAMIIQRLINPEFSTTTKMTFKTTKTNEQAGIIIYRSNFNYYALLKENSAMVLIKNSRGKKEVIARIPYDLPFVFMKVDGNNLTAQFSFGDSPDRMSNIGDRQSLTLIAEGNGNRFNGPGIGMYATSNGSPTKNKAFYDWFDYK